jgi:hypothetical protein
LTIRKTEDCFRALIHWGLLFCFTSSCSAAQQSPTTTQNSCRRFVQNFYDWYVPEAIRESDTSASDLAIKQKSAAFSPELLRELKQDSQAQAKTKGQIVGLDFDPFLNAQDPSSRYVVGKINASANKCLAEVYSVSSGKKSANTEVTPELVLKTGHWVFINFHYGKTKGLEDENLVSTLEKLQADRQKYSK